jgi:hypothetical protein
MFEAGLNGLGDEVKGILLLLLSAGFDHSQQGLDDPAAVGALRAEGALAPNVGVA